MVSETETDSGGIDLGKPRVWNAEQEEMQTMPDTVLAAPHVDSEQLDLSDDIASDMHSPTNAFIQESCTNTEVSGTWSADDLTERQKADSEIGIIYRWLEEGKVPFRDDVLRHGAGVRGYAAQ